MRMKVRGGWVGLGSNGTSFTITPANGTSPQTVTVTANLSPPTQVPSLLLSAATFSFQATQGGANPTPQTMSVTSSDGSPVGFTIGAGPGWLAVSPTSTTASSSAAVLTLSVSPSAMAQGVNSGSFTITPSNGTPAQTVKVTATLSLPGSPAALRLSAAAFSFQVTQGAGDPAPQTLNVTSSDGSPVAFNIGSTPAWLSVTGGSSTAAALTPHVNAPPLAPPANT